MDAEAESERVFSLIVRFDAVLHGARDSPSILLPKVGGVWKGGDGTLKDRLSSLHLTNASIRHRYLRSDFNNDEKYNSSK